MIRSLPELMKRVPGLHVIHQTGERDYNEAQSAYAQVGSPGGSAQVHR